MSSSNVRTDAVAITAASYVELTGYAETLTVYTDTEAVYLSAGYDTAADGTSFKLPANSSLVLDPVPSGKVFVKSVTGSQTIYVLGS